MSHYRIQKLASKYSIKYGGFFDFFTKKVKEPESTPQPSAESNELIKNIIIKQKVLTDLGLDTTGRGGGIPEHLKPEYFSLLSYYKDNPDAWTLYDAKKSKSTITPSDYEYALKFYSSPESPIFSLSTDLVNLADEDPGTWRDFGSIHFKGWTIDDVERLLKDLKI